MITHTTQVRVRYGEVDQMGFLYHAHYVDFFDVGRTELMRSIGLSNFAIEQAGVMLPVMEVNVKYINPAKYDDLITIETTLSSAPRATIEFEHKVYRQPSGQESTAPLELITTGRVKLAFMHASTKKATRPPQIVVEAMAKYF